MLQAMKVDWRAMSYEIFTIVFRVLFVAGLWVSLGLALYFPSKIVSPLFTLFFLASFTLYTLVKNLWMITLIILK